MSTPRQISLLVNDVAIELGEFVQEFIGHVITGMLAALRDTGEINSVAITIDEDNVTVNPITTGGYRVLTAGTGTTGRRDEVQGSSSEFVTVAGLSVAEYGIYTATN